MGTLKQKRVARRLAEVIENGEKITKGELLKSVDYSVSAQHQPSVILESQGVKDELTKLGFTEDNAKNVLLGILNSATIYEMVTPGDKIRAAQEVFKIFGTYAAEKSFNLTANASVDELKEIIQKDLAKFRTDK